jgi:hypothetical protein
LERPTAHNGWIVEVAPFGIVHGITENSLSVGLVKDVLIDAEG